MHEMLFSKVPHKLIIDIQAVLWLITAVGWSILDQYTLCLLPDTVKSLDMVNE